MNDNTHVTEAPFQHYQEAVNWITGLVSFGIKPGLKRMESILDRLGRPQNRLKFIHVAGTNGKGSTCAMLTQVLKDCGYHVGSFTSPYIRKFTDRIQINGEDISEEDVLSITNILKPIVDDIAQGELGQPTMFEVVTALAIQYFAKVAYPDLVVWETGLGGRLDSTNIVVPIASIITNVGHDHMEILGDTLAEVAEEKAGIIKPGVPVISTVEQPEVIEVIERIARKHKSTLYLLNNQFTFEPTDHSEERQNFHFNGPFRKLENISLGLIGEHQLKNASVAIMALEVLRQYYAVLADEEFILSGLQSVQWPGRMEKISESPTMILDGAHNPEGAASLARTLTHTYSYQDLHFMMGMISTKNHEAYLRHILPIARTLIVTEPDFHKKMDAKNLYSLAKQLAQELELSIDIMLEPSWKKALERLTERIAPDDAGVVSGTLYLISDVRSWILHHSESEKGW